MNKRIFLLSLLINFITLNPGICSENFTERGVEMSMLSKNVKNEDRYKNLSTAQSCITVTLKDADTGKSLKIIIGNEQFARLLAKQRGVSVGKMQVKSNQEAYLHFLNEQYVPYMLENEGKVIDLGMNLQQIKKSTPSLIYKIPLTFEQLNVSSEQELIEKFFDFNIAKESGTLKGIYYEKYTRDPSFIALLLSLGYDVVWGDYVPNLNIYTYSFLSHLKIKKTSQKP